MPTAVTAAVMFVGGWGPAASIALSVVSTGMSIAAAAKAKGAQAAIAEKKQMLRSSNAPKNHVYGTMMASGLLVLPQEEAGEQDDGEMLHLVIAVAGHEIDEIYDCRLDDVLVSEFGDYAIFEPYPQGRTTVDPYLLQHLPDWTDKMIGKGIAWFRLSLKYDQEKYPTGPPNVTVMKKGKRLFDPRTNKTVYSANAALVIRDYLITRNWKEKYLIDELFIQSANICDEVVTNADGSVTPRYEIHCEFDDNDSMTDILDKMLTACGGEWVRVGGKLGLKVAAYYGPAFYEITEDDIISETITLQPEVEMQDSFNTVRGTYVAVNQKYAQVDYPEVKVQEWIIEDGEEKVMNLDYDFVHNPFQAQRLADIALNKSRKALTLQLQCNYKAFGAVGGSLVSLTLGQLGMVKKEFAVTDWAYSLEGAVNLTLRLNSPEFYDDTIGNVPAIPPLVTLPTGGVPAPRNLHFIAVPIGDIVQGQIVWTNSAFKVASTNVVIKDGAGFVVQTISVPFPGQEALLSGKLSGSYSADVTAIGYLGRSSTVSLTFTIAEPSTPDVISVKASNWSIHLIPGYTTINTPYGTLFEFYVNTTQQTNPPLTTRKPDELASSWNHGGRTPDTYYYYWIRAVNSYGKSGWSQKTVKTTKDATLVETLVEKLVGIEIYAPYIASDQSSNPAFVLDGRPDHGNGLIKGAHLKTAEITSDNYVAGNKGYYFGPNRAEINTNVDIKAASIKGPLTAASINAGKITGDIVDILPKSVSDYSAEVIAVNKTTMYSIRVVNSAVYAREVFFDFLDVGAGVGPTGRTIKVRLYAKLTDGSIVSLISRDISPGVTGDFRFSGVVDVPPNSNGNIEFYLQAYAGATSTTKMTVSRTARVVKNYIYIKTDALA